MPIGRHASIPLREITLRASRSSGPGGQHANVTASRIEAIFDVAASSALTEEQKRRVIARLGPRVVAVAQDERSQTRNRELALQRLQRRLTSALRVARPRHETKPTRRRCSAGSTASAARPRASATAAHPGPTTEKCRLLAAHVAVKRRRFALRGQAPLYPHTQPMRWIVDGMNVIGTRPDAWWKDRDAAMLKLVDMLERWAASDGEDVTRRVRAAAVAPDPVDRDRRAARSEAQTQRRRR